MGKIELLKELKRIRNMVDEEIVKIKNSIDGPADLIESSFYLILSGGKRIRPFILIKSAELFDVDIDKSLPAAVAIELLHNFTLIHDDIMDKDVYRRGVKTTHVMFGEPIAIIAGDFLFSNVFSILSRYYPTGIAAKLVDVYSKTSNLICMGQTMDILPSKYIDSSETYIDMIYKKTGALMEASALSGGLIGGASEEEANALREYGRKIGIAFQIADDILGIIGKPEVTGKPVGSDIRNGKHTLLVLNAMGKMTLQQRTFFKKVFGNEDADEDDVKKAIEFIVESGVIEDARRSMEALYLNSVNSLNIFPESDAKQYLIEVSHFIIHRER